MEESIYTQEAFEQREAELTKRETEIKHRELRAEALQLLEVRGLPKNLANLLDYKDLNASIDAVEADWRACLQEGIDNHLKGTPPKAAIPTADIHMDSMRAALGLK